MDSRDLVPTVSPRGLQDDWTGRHMPSSRCPTGNVCSVATPRALGDQRALILVLLLLEQRHLCAARRRRHQWVWWPTSVCWGGGRRE
jgi:hypothetical protein